MQIPIETIFSIGAFPALLILGTWIFRNFAERLDKKDAAITDMLHKYFEHTAMSTMAIKEMTANLRVHSEESVEARKDATETRRRLLKDHIKMMDSLSKAIENNSER